MAAGGTDGEIRNRNRLFSSVTRLPSGSCNGVLIVLWVGLAWSLALGLSWGDLRASWGGLGRSLGPLLGHLGGLLGHLGDFLGHLGGLLGRLEAISEASESLCWVVLELSLIHI